MRQHAAAADSLASCHLLLDTSAGSAGGRKLPTEPCVLPPTVNSKNYLIVALALTTLGGAALAWRQYEELVELRAAAMDTNERSDLTKKIADLEKANKELRDQLAAAQGDRDDAGDTAAAPDQAEAGAARNGNGRFEARRAQFAAIRELMGKPEVQAMMNAERKAVLDSRYAALFQKLNLSPEQANKLADLLAQRQQARGDVFQAARDQGINPRTDPQGFQKLVADAEAPINDSIKSLIGDSGVDQLNNYEQTIPQRNIVNLLQQKLSYSDAPLSSSQADQLVQILATNAPQRTTGTTDANVGGRGPGGDFGRMGGMIGGGFAGGQGGDTSMMSLVGRNAPTITNDAVNQAQTVLTPAQVSALQQLQQQQKTAQQLQQLIRTTAQQAQQATGAAAPAPAARKGGGG